MDEKTRILLKKRFYQITRSLSLHTGLLAYLYQEGVLNDQMYEEVLLPQEETAQSERLILLLKKRGPLAVIHFKEGLRLSKQDTVLKMMTEF